MLEFLQKPFPITDLKALLARWRDERGCRGVVDYRPWTAGKPPVTIGDVEVR